MNQGFTGYGKETVKKNIESVFLDSRKIINDMGTLVEQFLSIVKFFWSSPHAVEFSNKYNPIIADTLNDALKSVISLCEKSRNAYNELATSNGDTPIERYPYEIGTKIYLQFDKCWPDQAGVVGIHPNIGNRVDSFAESIKVCLMKFDSISVEIAFYDPNDALAHSYREAWNEIRNHIEEQFNEVCEQIREAINTEVQTSELSVQRACELMNVPYPLGYGPLQKNRR